MTRGKRMIDLETYEGFIENPDSYLTINQLNQIIHLHGFTKVLKHPKRDVIGALNTMNLLTPLRSTLKENVSSYDSLPMEQVMEDLDILQWNDCPVQSVETVKLPREKVQRPYQQPATSFGQRRRLSEMVMAFGNTMKKPRSKRKRRSWLNASVGSNSTDVNVATVAADTAVSLPLFASLVSSTASLAVDWFLLETTENAKRTENSKRLSGFIG